MIYVLDTNVLCELMRPEPHPAVFAWVAAQQRTSLYVASLSCAEILAGIAILPRSRRRVALTEAAEAMFVEDFRDRILPFDVRAASAYAGILALRRRLGRPMATEDLVIAATAHAHEATVVTRNLSGFEGCGLHVIDPWATL